MSTHSELIKLNLGCGNVRPEGWYNADSSLNANLQRIPLIGKFVSGMFNTVSYESSNFHYINLNKRWTFEDNSVDVVYASHLYEHLTQESAKLFMEEAYRTLKPGGVCRIVVPDLYQISKRYISDYESDVENTTEFIMWAINMHREGQYGAQIPWIKKQVFEAQGYPHQHKFMYDSKSLEKIFTKFGFHDMRSLSYGVSEYIPDIEKMEGKEESYLSVYIEGLK